MAPPSDTPPPKRCLKCFYILDHLESRTCPECGTAFDPADPASYTAKPPFVWWTFWMPAFLLAGAGGGILWMALVFAFGFTASTTITVPIAMGVVLGYGGRIRLGLKILLALITLGVALAILAGGGFVGGFCAAIVGVIALIPIFVGVFAGWMLRLWIYHNTKFSQREYLRARLLPLLVVFFPVLAAIIEGRHPLLSPVIVISSQVIDAPPMQAWNGIQFFEEVRRPTPWLLYLSPQLRPIYTIGHSEKAGDLKTCVYAKGKLIKQITEVIPGKRLAFRVVEQDRIETDGARLLDGSFDLEPIDFGNRTRVTLTTRYVPKLNPRFAYKWAESLAIHTLHGHVLAGMKDTAEHPVENNTR